MGHTIEVVHTEGCAGAPQALENARLLAAERSDVVVTTVLVAGPDDALAREMRGSPTILVDGQDIEPESSIPVGTMG